MLKKVTIHKFRSCEETTVDLDQPLSALCGKNGVGKTTILQAIEWIAREAIAPAPSIWMVSAFNEPRSIELELMLDGAQYTYSMRRAPSDLGTPGLVEVFSIFDHGGKSTRLFDRENATIRIHRKSRTINTRRLTPAATALLALLPEDDPLLDHVKLLDSFFRRIRYYPLNDSVLDTNLITESYYNDWKNQYENDGAATDSVEMRLVYLWNEKRMLLDEIRHILGPHGLGLIEEFKVVESPLLEASTDPAREIPYETKRYLPYFRLSDSMGGAGKNLAFSTLSEGTRRIIRLVTSLIFDDRSLMMLEQPEDAIHPGLLHKVIDLLKTYSDRTQVLMATHSPTVLDSLDPENILLVTAPRGVTQVRRLSAEDLEHARLFLQDQGSLSEFLGPMVDELSLEDAG